MSAQETNKPLFGQAAAEDKPEEESKPVEETKEEEAAAPVEEAKDEEEAPPYVDEGVKAPEEKKEEVSARLL